MTDLVVVGLDGAGFHLLDDWLDDGTLPNLARYAEEGASAPLRSTYPPVTCPAWRCYSSGTNPGKLGVFWWENVDREAGTFSVPTSVDFAAPDVWDLLGDGDLDSAVVNMPTTYPPDEFSGWMVSGGGGVDGNRYTHPPELQEELEERFDYRVFASGASRNIGDDPDRIEEVLELVDLRFDVADYLRERYDPSFISLTIFYTNVFHHFFWDDAVTERLWRHVDRRIGEFIEDETVLVVSDHGSNPIDHVFNLNTWLEREGYLVTNRGTSDRLYGLGLTRDRLSRLADRLGLKNALKRALPRSVVSTFPEEDGTVSGHGKAEKIDWTASTAMASGQGPVYALAEDPAERRRIRDDLAAALDGLTAPDGSSLFRDVLSGKEAYDGPFVVDGPDLVVDQADGVHVSGAVGADTLFERPSDWVAENHRDGVLVAAGPDVGADVTFEEQPHIYDVAPTILHAFDRPVPDHVDGRVLTELFARDSGPASRAVETAPGALEDVEVRSKISDQEQMRDRLEDLGYLSE